MIRAVSVAKLESKCRRREALLSAWRLGRLAGVVASLWPFANRDSASNLASFNQFLKLFLELKLQILDACVLSVVVAEVG